MNKETQKAFFINIIQCFSAAETREHFRDVKVKIKKRPSFTSGPILYLTCIGNRLLAFKNKLKNDVWREFHI
jgi:hypothetical protein